MQLFSKVFALAPVERRFVLLAWLLAPAVSVALREKRLTPLLEWLRASAGMRPWRGRVLASDDISVERGEALVASAFHRQLATRSCLPQSLVQFLLHRSFGPTPKLVIGVRRDAALRARDGSVDWTVDAHAWVERSDGPPRDLGFAPIFAFSDEGGIWGAAPDAPRA